MEIIDKSFDSPISNIEFDTKLLMDAESGLRGESLRFWESGEYFIVLGRSGKEEEECFAGRARQDSLPVIKRASGGGTVLQGPGCLNYSLILSYGRNERYRNIRGSYETILGEICIGLREKGVEAEVLPISDLAVNNKKFSGNAQARKKKYFLHHGTFLYDFDLEKISYYLKHPPKEPAYRHNRKHSDFVTNISLTPDQIKDCIVKSFASDTKYIN